MRLNGWLVIVSDSTWRTIMPSIKLMGSQRHKQLLDQTFFSNISLLPIHLLRSNLLHKVVEPIYLKEGQPSRKWMLKRHRKILRQQLQDSSKWRNITLIACSTLQLTTHLLMSTKLFKAALMNKIVGCPLEYSKPIQCMCIHLKGCKIFQTPFSCQEKKSWWNSWEHALESVALKTCGV